MIKTNDPPIRAHPGSSWAMASQFKSFKFYRTKCQNYSKTPSLAILFWVFIITNIPIWFCEKTKNYLAAISKNPKMYTNNIRNHMNYAPLSFQQQRLEELRYWMSLIITEPQFSCGISKHCFRPLSFLLTLPNIMSYLRRNWITEMDNISGK